MTKTKHEKRRKVAVLFRNKGPLAPERERRTAMSGGWGRLGLRRRHQHELFVVKQLDPRTGNAREAQINMGSFRKARITLLDAYMDGLLDDDEFLVL